MTDSRILVAPDSFKGSLNASAVGAALAQGIGRTSPQAEVLMHPLADGGEGTLAALAMAGFDSVDVEVIDSHGRPITARIARRDDIAVVESAQAVAFESGASPAHALSASSAGVGMMIATALDMPISRLYLAVGGSATTDGGAGMLHALGARFFHEGKELIPEGGASLGKITSLESDGIHPRVKDVTITLLSDVDNPLLGRRGAARVFAPQKGADVSGVDHLEKALEHYAALVGPDYAMIPGSGAGGGIGFGALAALGASVTSGATAIMEITGFDHALNSASLVITGEGSFDDQSAAGKVPSAVIAAAVARGIPVAVVCGVDRRSAAARSEQPGLRVYQLVDIEPSIDRCIDNAHDLLVLVGEEIGRAS